MLMMPAELLAELQSVSETAITLCGCLLWLYPLLIHQSWVCKHTLPLQGLSEMSRLSSPVEGAQQTACPSRMTCPMALTLQP